VPVSCPGLNADDGKHLIDIAGALQHVVLSQLDALDSLKAWDGPTTVHYVDPPYHPDTRLTQDERRPGLLTRNQYAYEFTDDQHRKLLALLNELQGKVVLSGLPHPLYDQVLQGWQVVQLAGQDCDRKDRPEMLWIKDSVK
jgi:DNA adenine methylase